MAQYRIIDPDYYVERFWIVEAESQDQALDINARNHGYKDHADACEQTGPDGAERLIVEEEPAE